MQSGAVLPGSQIHWDQACRTLNTYAHGSQTILSFEHTNWKKNQAVQNSGFENVKHKQTELYYINFKFVYNMK